jgi:DNA-binding transcriptional ArsR family regulator
MCNEVIDVAAERRRRLTEPEAVRALTHPVRLELLIHLMSAGPATASECARAVGDTPSNCSYHLRVLARNGLVEADESDDGRERPWRARVTGIESPGSEAEPGTPEATDAAALMAVSVQRDQRLILDYLARRDAVDGRWRHVDMYNSYTLRATPEETRALGDRLDALIRPYIAALRDDPPADADLVHMNLTAFPRDTP